MFDGSIVVAERHDTRGDPREGVTTYGWENLYADRVAGYYNESKLTVGGNDAHHDNSSERASTTYPIRPFNAGVVLFDLRKFSELNLLPKMISVLKYHNDKQALWDRGTNQPAFEIALGDLHDEVVFVSPLFNCRNMLFQHLGSHCIVIHQKGCSLTSSSIAYIISRAIEKEVLEFYRYYLFIYHYLFNR